MQVLKSTDDADLKLANNKHACSLPVNCDRDLLTSSMKTRLGLGLSSPLYLIGAVAPWGRGRGLYSRSSQRRAAV